MQCTQIAYAPVNWNPHLPPPSIQGGEFDIVWSQMGANPTPRRAKFSVKSVEYHGKNL